MSDAATPPPPGLPVLTEDQKKIFRHAIEVYGKTTLACLQAGVPPRLALAAVMNSAATQAYGVNPFVLIDPGLRSQFRQDMARGFELAMDGAEKVTRKILFGTEVAK